jgi:hypothetical protein
VGVEIYSFTSCVFKHQATSSVVGWMGACIFIELVHIESSSTRLSNVCGPKWLGIVGEQSNAGR